MPVTSELRTLKMWGFLCSRSVFLLSVNIIGKLALCQRSLVNQNVFIKMIIGWDYCIEAHSRCIIEPVAPTDVVCPLNYSLSEQGYQKKRSKYQICIALFLLSGLECISHYLFHNKPT